MGPSEVSDGSGRMHTSGEGVSLPPGGLAIMEHCGG